MSSENAARRLIGLLGSWALFVLGFGLASIAVAGQWINFKDHEKLRRYGVIEKLLNERVAARAAELEKTRGKSDSSRSETRSKMASVSREFGRTDGRFLGVPAPGVLPDGWFVEMGRKSGLSVIRLGPGQAIDADTGRVAQRTGGGVWSWLGKSAGSRRILTVKNDSVVEISADAERELPAGALIRAAETLVIPPVGTPQRIFSKVPTVMAVPWAAAPEPPKKPAAAVIAAIAAVVNPPAAKVRAARLREAGESMFGKAWTGK